MTDRFKLGDRVRDVASEIEGTAFGRSTFMTGCDQIAIKRSGTDKDGKAFDLHWVDAPLVEKLDGEGLKLADPAALGAETGGPSLHSPSRIR